MIRGDISILSPNRSGGKPLQMVGNEVGAPQPAGDSKWGPVLRKPTVGNAYWRRYGAAANVSHSSSSAYWP